MGHVDNLFSQAFELHRAGKAQQAVELLKEVLRAEPRHARAWHQLGCLALESGNPRTGIELLARAIRLDGAQATYHNNLGECYRSLGQLDDARASYQRAIQLAPTYVAPSVNLAWTLRAAGRTAEADRQAEQALALPRLSPDERCICATLLLAWGRMTEGWAEHERRLEVPSHEPRATAGTRWDGSPLAGRTVLIYAEQGLGDTLQWVRYVPELETRGGRVVLAVQKSLVPMLRSAGFENLVANDEPWPRFDVHAGTFSLPYLLGTTLETIPASACYLKADPELTARWQNRLANRPGLKIGISWQGNPRHKLDALRSIPRAEFAQLAIEGVQLISLQKNVGSTDKPPFPLIDLTNELDVEHGAFMDTAAVMQNLDLVVTCDTVIAHLAGALGVPVWVGLSTTPDWRWMFDRTDSPWYPTMRLFRQQKPGDWSSVFSQMAQELRGLIAARSERPPARDE